jgi:hypothetical protein
LFFNTQQKPIDLYIEEELGRAKEERREKGRKLHLA